jgi:hypothetical protein
MKQVLLELDDDTASRLEKVAPARSRRRSEFIRAAIRRALWDLAEAATEEAYRREPDSEPPPFDPATWGAWEVRDGAPRAGRHGRSRKK